MAIKLSPTQAVRIIALIEALADAFQFCLGELAGDSVLVEDKQRAERDLEDHRAEMDRPVSRRNELYLLSDSAIEERHEAIDAYNAVHIVAKIIDGEIKKAKAAKIEEGRIMTMLKDKLEYVTIETAAHHIAGSAAVSYWTNNAHQGEFHHNYILDELAKIADVLGLDLVARAPSQVDEAHAEAAQ